MDFDAKQFVPMIARMVLSSISQNFRYALDGAVAALAVMLIFHGEGTFRHRMWSLQFALAVTFVVAYVMQRGIAELVGRIDGAPVAAEPTTESPAERGASAPGTTLSAKSVDKRQADGANLD